MSRTITKRDKTVNRVLTKILTGWDMAIVDARRGIVRLERAIEVFEEKKLAGVPWPEDEKAGTEAESIPAV